MSTPELEPGAEEEVEPVVVDLHVPGPGTELTVTLSPSAAAEVDGWSTSEACLYLGRDVGPMLQRLVREALAE